MAQPNIEYKNYTTSKRILPRAMGLSWFQPMYSFPVTGDAQHCDSEHIMETSDGNPTGIVIELCIAIAVFC